MKKGFYPHLAFDGIRKNKRLYLPYILTQIGMIMMFYIVIFLRYGKSLEGTFGDKTVNVVLMLGGWVIAIFACIFLFYTNSFLIRRRKKEFGLYNILGMDKKNISILLFWESLITSAISLFCGLVLGVALSKLAELGLIKVMNRTEVSYSFYVSPTAILLTAGVFSVIFLLLFLNSVRQIMSADAVTLLRSESLGEKPPKANPLLGVIGVLLLLGAYTIAVVVDEPQTAVRVFFIAVIMVIVGTYLLMISALCSSAASCKAQELLLSAEPLCLRIFDDIQDEAKRRGTRVRLRARNDGARHDILDRLSVLRHGEQHQHPLSARYHAVYGIYLSRRD